MTRTIKALTVLGGLAVMLFASAGAVFMPSALSQPAFDCNHAFGLTIQAFACARFLVIFSLE